VATTVNIHPTQSPIKISELETKRLQQAINDKPEAVMDIINSTELCICITDAKGCFVSANDNYLRHYEYTLDQLKGQHFSVVLPPEDRPRLSRAHDMFMQSKFDIIRKWKVMARAGRVMDISADAMYTEAIWDNQPYKVTFVQIENANFAQVDLSNTQVPQPATS
jgi:PAS domain S-box-containing protein